MDQTPNLCAELSFSVEVRSRAVQGVQMTKKSSRNVTEFLNIDLDIKTTYKLQDLLNALKPYLFDLNPDYKHEVSLELNWTKTLSIDETIKGFFEAFSSLSKEQRRIWDRCEMRRMNIGIQAGNEPRSSMFCISEDSVSKLHKMGTEIALTIYSPEKAAPEKRSKRVAAKKGR
jgi:hypothetical protein